MTGTDKRPVLPDLNEPVFSYYGRKKYHPISTTCQGAFFRILIRHKGLDEWAFIQLWFI